MRNFQLADGVRRVGFRKWYERELLTSHAHMVLAFLAVIGLLGAFEALRGAGETDRLGNVLLAFVCAGTGLWALRRYLYLLTRAEDAANQASCGGCGEYGRFQVRGSPPDGGTEVCCHKCSHLWTIHLEDRA